MNYIELCLRKFNELPTGLKDFLNSQEVLDFLSRIEKEYGIDLTFVVVLIFIGELDLENLDIYLIKKFNIDQIISNKIMFEMENNIFKKVLGLSETLSRKDYLLDLDENDRNKKIIDIFSENLLKQFYFSVDVNYLLQLNAIIFESISSDESFIEKIKRLFLESNEVLTSKKITIKEKIENATISNWIKDFVTENGSDMFSPIVLAKYLISSKNVALLDDTEKQLLRQVLKMYRNLFFFPESMGNANYIDWEIFPINKDLLNINFQRKKLEDNNKKEDKIQYKPVNSRAEEVVVLKELLKKYSDKGLEKKAIENEIKKIEEN